MEIKFEYERGGTLAHHVAKNVFAAAMFRQIIAATSVATFDHLVHQVTEQAPYPSKERVL